MASIEHDANRRGWRVQIYVRGVRRKLWLGPVGRSAAKIVAGHLDALNLARDTGTPIPATTRRWSESISDRIRDRLIAWGLVESVRSQMPTTLGDFTQSYIDGRSDWKPRTVGKMRNVRRHLISRIGAEKPLKAITPADAQRFARWCREKYANSHAGKMIIDARQFFTAAIAERLIAENPFDGIAAGQKHRAEREAYVSAETAEKLIANACPYFAALIAVARYGGLRVPSEPLTLEWSHVDWSGGRWLVTSPKTAGSKPTRELPLFPTVRPHLERLYDLAPDGSRWVFDRYRSTASKVYRDNLERIIRLAGVEQWPKLYMNLRASCRTDLLERFPEHVVNYWLGHSGKVGAAHYNRVHDGHYIDAVGLPVGLSSRDLPDPPDTKNEKTLGKSVFPRV